MKPSRRKLVESIAVLVIFNVAFLISLTYNPAPELPIVFAWIVFQLLLVLATVRGYLRLRAIESVPRSTITIDGNWEGPAIEWRAGSGVDEATIRSFEDYVEDFEKRDK